MNNMSHPTLLVFTKTKQKCRLMGKNRPPGCFRCSRLEVHQHLHESSSSLLIWNIQVCINTAPTRKDIRNDRKESAADSHQTGKCQKAFSFRQLPVFPGADIPATSPQGHTFGWSKKLKKGPKTAFQTLQVSVSLLERMRVDLEKDLFEEDSRKNTQLWFGKLHLSKSQDF